MNKRKTISHEEVGISAHNNIKGFLEGVESQAKIIKLGALIKKMREHETKLNQTEAATLIGMSQSELSRIESGSGVQGPSFATITQIVDAYKKLLFEEDGTTVNLSIEVDRPNHRHQSYLLSEELTNIKLEHE